MPTSPSSPNLESFYRGAYTLARLAELRQEEPAAVRRAGLRESRA